MVKSSQLSITMDSRAAFKLKPPLDTQNEEDVVGKIVIITGASAGLGAGTALEMAKRGAIVGMCCRDMAKAKKVVEDIKSKVPDAKLELFALDLGSLDSVRKCSAEVQEKFPHINILINNAGVMNKGKILLQTEAGFESNMGINHLGHFLWTNLLLDYIKKGAPSRIVFVSSMDHLMADLNVSDLFLTTRGPFADEYLGAYGNSKLANMYTAKSLSKLLKNDGVNAYALCPGQTVTELNRDAKDGFAKAMADFTNKMMSVKIEEGITTILYCTLSKACTDETGLMYRHNGVWENAMENATDDDVERHLWETSEFLVGLRNSQSA